MDPNPGSSDDLLVSDGSSDPDSESLTTNATADNLPGPGRNLGNLYSFLGQPLERHINKIAWKLAPKPTVEPDPPLVTSQLLEQNASMLTLYQRRCDILRYSHQESF